MKYNLKNDFKRKNAIAYFKKLLDKNSLIEIKEIKPIRSTNQNSLYWLYLTCIEKETGTNRDDLHLYFKAKFLGFDNVEMFGENIERPKSTAQLDTKQFTDYMNNIVNFALIELSIVMPDPESKRLQEFYNEYSEFL